MFKKDRNYIFVKYYNWLFGWRQVQLQVQLLEDNLNAPSPSAQRLKTIRGKRSQAEFAQLLGIHKSTLGRYERGENEPDASVIRTMCSFFGIESKWFISGEGDMYADGRQEPPALVPQTTATNEPAGVDPTSEINALRQENRELRGENRELRQENRELLKQNADLRVELAEMKARAAPAQTPGESAKKIA